MKLNKYIDHTILKADAKKDDIIRLCDEAKRYGFASVCVNSCYAELVHNQLCGSDVKTCCVVGFPLGAMAKEAKAFETKTARKHGADEIDMVINIGALKDGDEQYVYEDIKGVTEAADGACVKVIIETCLLSDEQKILACTIAERAGADFVKTSTGFSLSGANEYDVALMKKSVSEKVKVKASGGIRTKQDAEKLIRAGADRIGASAGIEICK